MDQPTNIRTLFASAKALRKQLNASPEPTSSAYQENLRAAITSFDECRKLADQIALFSPNETQDDISSGDLQYEPWSSKCHESGVTDSAPDIYSPTTTLAN